MTMKKVYIATFPKIDGSLDYRVAVSDHTVILNCYDGSLEDQDRYRHSLFGHSVSDVYSDINKAFTDARLRYPDYLIVALIPFERPIRYYTPINSDLTSNEKIFPICKISILSTLGTKQLQINGVLHREDGPAIEYPNGTKLWFYHGEPIYCSSQEEFEMLIKYNKKT